MEDTKCYIALSVHGKSLETNGQVGLDQRMFYLMSGICNILIKVTLKKMTYVIC